MTDPTLLSASSDGQFQHLFMHTFSGVLRDSLLKCIAISPCFVTTRVFHRSGIINIFILLPSLRLCLVRL